MTHLALSVASLRIFGEELQPDDISKLLGCAPTKAWSKGEVQVSRSGREFVKKSGGWLLHASDAEPENVDGQVSELLAKLSSDLGVWTTIAQRYDVDLFCGWFMESSNEGVSISVATMRALAERGIELSLDIYGPDESAAEVEPAPAQQAVPADVPASASLQQGRG